MWDDRGKDDGEGWFEALSQPIPPRPPVRDKFDHGKHGPPEQ